MSYSYRDRFGRWHGSDWPNDGYGHMNYVSTDSRIVSGARCMWWDSIDKVATNSHGLPCCPHCGSVLYEVPDEKAWFKGVDEYESQGHPGYRKFIEWLRGKCFKTYDEAMAKYKQEVEE